MQVVQKVIPLMSYDGGDFQEWKAAARAKLSQILGMDKFEKVAPEFEVEYKKKISKFHLNNPTKTKSYSLSLNNLKDGEAILLEDAKEPVLVDIDFYN